MGRDKVEQGWKTNWLRTAYWEKRQWRWSVLARAGALNHICDEGNFYRKHRDGSISPFQCKCKCKFKIHLTVEENHWTWIESPKSNTRRQYRMHSRPFLFTNPSSSLGNIRVESRSWNWCYSISTRGVPRWNCRKRQIIWLDVDWFCVDSTYDSISNTETCKSSRYQDWHQASKGTWSSVRCTWVSSVPLGRWTSSVQRYTPRYFHIQFYQSVPAPVPGRSIDQGWSGGNVEWRDSAHARSRTNASCGKRLPIPFRRRYYQRRRRGFYVSYARHPGKPCQRSGCSHRHRRSNEGFSWCQQRSVWSSSWRPWTIRSGYISYYSSYWGSIQNLDLESILQSEKWCPVFY